MAWTPEGYYAASPDGTVAAIERKGGRAAADEVLASYPIGRTGVPADNANAALFLASDLSA